MSDVPAQQSRAMDWSDRESLERLTREVLERAVDAGAGQAEAAVSAGSGLSASVRLGEVDSLEHHRDRGLHVTVFIDQRKGSASTADLSPASVAETVRMACDIARYTEPDECAGLAAASRMAHEIPDLDLWHPWSIEAEQAIEMARVCEEAARGYDSRIGNSEGATLSTGSSRVVYGNTHGFVGELNETTHSLSCAVVAGADDEMQVDHWYTIGRAPEDLQDPESVGRRAGERAVSHLGAKRLSTRQTPVLFKADVAQSLVQHFAGAVSGGNLYRRASFLLDRRGERIFPEQLRIRERPHLPRAMGSAPFDTEGVATYERDLVSEGILRDYILGTYSACKLGLESTGNADGTHNLCVDAGELDFEALLAEMGTGLLVTKLMGQGVSLVTGDYSRGAAGFWVENGRIAHPVQEITVAGNLADMFLGLQRVGSDVDTRTGVRTGSMLIDRMTIAGE